MQQNPYYHVDVFAQRPYTGNSLTVFTEAHGLDAQQMLDITQEMRHFESIFLLPTAEKHVVQAHVFDLFEELEFAGHPLLGAGAVLHHLDGRDEDITWTLRLPNKEARVVSSRDGQGFRCTLDQGMPEFLGTLSADQINQVCESLNLTATDLVEGLPFEVVSTGLKYLIVPVRGALEKAKILSDDFGDLLASFGAQFVYVLDVGAKEGRHWNNDGIQEDVATGSAAGTVGAYLAKHGVQPLNEAFILHQGRYVGRPSEIRVRPVGEGGKIESVLVGGDVAFVASGVLCNLPSEAGNE